MTILYYIVGGWNNNPTVTQFKAAFRKLISRCGAESGAGKTGNVTLQEQVDMIQTTTACEEVNDVFEPTIPTEQPHNTTLLGNAVVYIAGWVVRKVLKKLSCDPCRIALVTVTPSPKYNKYHMLLQLKNNGGLIYPSDGCITVVGLVDKYLRAVSHPKLIECNCYVFEHLGTSDVFNLGDHVFDTAIGITNHSISLVRAVVEVFYDLRLHHYARLNNLKLHGTSIRHRNTKAVLFMGQ